MPIPQKKDNEKQADYMGRCMHKLAEDKMPNKQKVAICLNNYKNSKKKAKAELELDFTEDIKNMNKKEEKIETKPEIKAETNTSEQIQTALLQMQNQYKIFHWQTTSYAQHKSFDEIIGSLSGNIDNFIETYMGKYGRIIASNTFNFALSNLDSANIINITDSYVSFLIGLNNIFDSSKDSDLLNIRDEILGDLNRLKYLLSLS